MSFDINQWQQQLKCGHGEAHDNSEILQISLDEGIEMKYRLLCKHCLQTPSGKFERMGIQQTLQAIKEKYESIQKHRSDQINQEKKFIIEIKENITNLKTELNKLLSELDSLFNHMENDFQNLMEFDYVLMDEIQEIAEKQNKSLNLIIENFNNQITKIKNSYSVKFQDKVKKLQDSMSFTVNKFTQYNSRNKESENLLIQNNIQRMSRLKTIKHSETNQKVKHNKINEINCQYCLALAFDYQSKQLAVSSKDFQVEIYKIENGNIENRISTLQHNDKIYSIIYSKNENWLATGSQKGEITIWKFLNSQWEKYTSSQQHDSTVFCLLLNQNEDLLLSCSQDQSIIIWNLDINQNKIQKQQQIITEAGIIYSISLNQSENILACCCQKDQIQIWENQGKWIYRQAIKLSENGLGFRLSFYDDILIFQPQNMGVCKVYMEKNKEFIEISQIQLDEKQIGEKIGLSPIKYNQIKNVMIIKYKKQLDQTFQIIGEPVSYQNEFHFSTISYDGQYLAQWTNDKKIALFRLDYE